MTRGFIQAIRRPLGIGVAMIAGVTVGAGSADRRVAASPLHAAAQASPQSAAPAARDQAAPLTAEALAKAIDSLGSFDFDVRTAAGRAIRRAPATQTAPALAAAVRGHK